MDDTKNDVKQKTWEQLSDSEKIERLRGVVKSNVPDNTGYPDSYIGE